MAVTSSSVSLGHTNKLQRLSLQRFPESLVKRGSALGVGWLLDFLVVNCIFPAVCSSALGAFFRGSVCARWPRGMIHSRVVSPVDGGKKQQTHICFWSALFDSTQDETNLFTPQPGHPDRPVPVSLPCYLLGKFSCLEQLRLCKQGNLEETAKLWIVCVRDLRLYHNLKSWSISKTWVFFEQQNGRRCLLAFEIQKPVSSLWPGLNHPCNSRYSMILWTFRIFFISVDLNQFSCSPILRCQVLLALMAFRDCCFIFTKASVCAALPLDLPVFPRLCLISCCGLVQFQDCWGKLASNAVWSSCRIEF